MSFFGRPPKRSANRSSTAFWVTMNSADVPSVTSVRIRSMSVLADSGALRLLAEAADRGARGGADHRNQEQRAQEQAPERAPSCRTCSAVMSVAGVRPRGTHRPRDNRVVDDFNQVICLSTLDDLLGSFGTFWIVELPYRERGHDHSLHASRATDAAPPPHSALTQGQ